jgi:endonuclease-3
MADHFMKSLQRIIAQLEKRYGTPAAPLSDPFELILWENIGYLINDEKRKMAFERLRKEVGLKPSDILSAPPARLFEIAKLGGIHPETRAQRLREIAHIVFNDFDGDLNQALKLPLPKAIKALKKFPSIGDPGAEKILLFTKTYPVLALESNGLRVLLRLGFGEEQKNYSASYRSVREALADQIGDDCDFLIKAHELLRLHGKEICKTNHPKCDLCPLNETCQGAFLK